MKRAFVVLAVLLIATPAMAGALIPGTYTTEGGYKEIFFNGEGKAGMGIVANGSGGTGGVWSLGDVGNEATNALDAVLTDSGPGWVEYTTEYAGDFLMKESAATWGGSGDMAGEITSLIVQAVFDTTTGKYVGGKFTGVGYVTCGGNDVAIRMVGKLTEEDRAFDAGLGVWRHDGNIYKATLTIVPLPAAAWMGLGLLAVLGAIRRRRRSRS